MLMDTDKDMVIAQRLDLRGLRCPLPVLKARKAIKSLNDGDIIEIIADDAATTLDFPHFCETSGHQLLSAANIAEANAQPLFNFKIAVKGQ